VAHLQALLAEDWYETLFQGAWPTRDEAMRDLGERGLVEEHV
jgi:hypothetical protein